MSRILFLFPKILNLEPFPKLRKYFHISKFAIFNKFHDKGTPVEVPSNRISSFTHVRLREFRPQILTRNVKKMAKIGMFPRV